MTLIDYGVFSNRVKQLRRESILETAREIAEGQPLALAKEILIDARREADSLPEPDITEVERWGESPIGGLAFVLWHQLEKKYPNQFDEAKIQEVIQKRADDAKVEALKFAMQQAKGSGQPGESQPRDDEKAEAGKPASDTQANLTPGSRPGERWCGD